MFTNCVPTQAHQKPMGEELPNASGAQLHQKKLFLKKKKREVCITIFAKQKPQKLIIPPPSKFFLEILFI